MPCYNAKSEPSVLRTHAPQPSGDNLCPCFSPPRWPEADAEKPASVARSTKTDTEAQAQAWALVRTQVAAVLDWGGIGSSTHQALHLLFVAGTHWRGGDRRERVTARAGPQVRGWLDEGQLVARSGSERRRYGGHGRAGTWTWTWTAAGLGDVGDVGDIGWLVGARPRTRDSDGASGRCSGWRLCRVGRIHRGLRLARL